METPMSIATHLVSSKTNERDGDPWAWAVVEKQITNMRTSEPNPFAPLHQLTVYSKVFARSTTEVWNTECKLNRSSNLFLFLQP